MLISPDKIILILCLGQSLILLEIAAVELALGGYYKSSCSKSIPCDAAKNFSCDMAKSRCSCAVHPKSDHVFIFDIDVAACVPILEKDTKRFWDCEERRYDENFNEVNETDLGFCKSDHECQRNYGSSNWQCNFERCSCECKALNPETGLEVENVNDSCKVKYLECQADIECVQKYGIHSICDFNASICGCHQQAKFYNGKCTREQQYNETCESDIECELGMGPNSICDMSDNRLWCECVDGFVIDEDTGKCIAEMKSVWTVPEDQQEPSHNCYKIPLIILGIICATAVATLLTALWCIQNKSRKYNFRRLDGQTGLDLALSLSVSKDTLDEKTYL